METLNRNHISYQEMDGLIGLAEKVSKNMERGRALVKDGKVLIITFLFIFVIDLTIIFFGKIDVLFNMFTDKIIPSIILLTIFFLAFSSIILILTILRKINKAKLLIDSEEKNLQKLLNMIEGYKDIYIENEYGTESSVLSKTLFEMRLSRINFDVK